MVSKARLAVACGIVGLTVSYGSVALAIALSPSFRWTDNALSDLGAVGTDLAWIFNGGLVLAGLFFLAFAFGVFATSSHRIELVGAFVIAIVYFLTLLVGIFPHPRPLHTPIALVQFVLIPIGLWTYGIGNVRRGAVRLGSITIGLGLVSLVANGWLITAISTESTGAAVPELAVLTPLDLWAVLTIRRLT